MDLFTIKKCSNCRHRLVDLEKLESKLRQVLSASDFNTRLRGKIDGSKTMHHQKFHIALAGCPNSCSQPQIKDFGVQGQAVPEINGGCSQCGACVEVCREEAIKMGRHAVVIDRNRCLNCGQCIHICPTGALREGQVGFRVLAGGKLGRHPRLATELTALASEDETAAWLDKCIELFLTAGKPGQRFGSLMDQWGNKNGVT